MFDRVFLYDILYALAACGGREQQLFGTDAQLAHEAFCRSVVGAGFPELWFELPLSGDPWFDLHVLTNREALKEQEVQRFEPVCLSIPCGLNAPSGLFDWFARQQDARQLALSYDVSRGDIDHPAVQLLLYRHNIQLTCDFLAKANRADAVPSYRSFMERLPHAWFACYTGVFPGRSDLHVRVECVPDATRQLAYAQDKALLAADLQQAGLSEMSDSLLDRCHMLAQTPFPIEFQFDVTPEGQAGQAFAASVRFDCPPGTSGRAPFEGDGAAGELMQHVESWGLADDRWRLLQNTSFAKKATLGGDMLTLFCYPAFLKLRWRSGRPLDAKAYLMAGAE